MYKKTILDNGLKVLTEYIPGFRSVSLGIWINAGSKYETQKQNGISHFIEHLMFKGTKKYSAKNIAEIMDSLGGMLNAFTEKEQTCYYAKVSDKHLTVAVDLLSDMLLNSVFKKEDIELERSVILDEIRMHEDSPDEHVFELFYKSLWPNHPLGRSTLGTEAIISKMTRVDMLDFINKHYTPSNIIITAAGCVEHDKLLKQAQKIFSHKRAGRKHTEEPYIKTSRKKIIMPREGEQSYVCIGGGGVSQRDEEKYKIFVLDSILGGSMSSRLFQEIREKRGLVYTVASFQHAFYNSGLFGIYYSTHIKNAQKVADLVFKINDQMKKKGPTKEEMIRAKEHIKGSIILSYEDTVNRMLRLAKSEFYNKKLTDIDEILRKIENVTHDDVLCAANKYLNKEHFALAAIGSAKGELDVLG